VILNPYRHARARPAWSPAELPSSLLKIWLDADDVSTMTLNGDDVSIWTDKSGNNVVFEDASTIEPVLETNVLNGKRGVFFESSSMNTPIQNAPLAVEDKYVVAVLTQAAGEYFLYGTTHNSGLVNNSYKGWFAGVYTSSNTRYNYYAQASRGNRYASIQPLTLGTGVILAQSYAASFPTSASLLANGSLQSTSGSLTNPAIAENTVTGAAFSIGKIGSAANAGHLHELLVLNAWPGWQTVWLIDGYLAHKWGLDGKLAASHLFKAAPP